jgi:uncharacterized protein (TIGR02118 family)
MVTQLVLLTRRSDMSFEQFSTYWKNVHAPIGGKMPEVIKYVQYHGGVAPANGAPAYDGVALLQFADMGALQRSWGSREGQATAADIPNFLDSSKIVMLFNEEHQVV